MAGRQVTTESETHRARRLALVAGLKYELVPIASVDAAIAALPPASTVSVTCSPNKGIEATMALTDRVRSLGHTAVPHIAARMVAGPEHVARLAHWLRSEQVGHLFLVGGDANPPLGPYHDATSFLRDLLEAGPNLSTVGVAAYPDGHPFIETNTLSEALYGKQRMLAAADVSGYACTQMCFDAETIARWLSAHRQAGLTLPIHLGVAGVVDRSKLMTMGVRLGIGTSLRYLKKNRAAIGRLLSSSTFDPNNLLVPLSPSIETLGITGLHCFTFNQVAATVAWQRLTLEP